MKFESFNEAQDNHVKMIKMKTNGWHFKVQKYVFKNVMAANPSSFKNLCPYFWMLIMALLIAPFKGVIDLLKYPFIMFGKALLKALETSVDDWFANLTDDEAYRLSTHYSYLAPKNVQEFMDKNGGRDNIDIFNAWCERKFGYGSKELKKRKDGGYLEFLERSKKKREVLRVKRIARDDARVVKKVAKKARAQRTINRFDKMADWADKHLSNMVSAIRNFFSFKTPEQIIRWAKRIVGLIITLIISGLLYFVINAIVFVVILIVQSWSNDVAIEWVMYLGLGIGIIGIIIGIALTGAWINDLIEQDKENPWFIKVPIFIFYMIWNPLRFIGIYIFYIPFYFIFVTAIYRFIGISIIGGFFMSFWNVFSSAGNIFSQYLGSSYNDFCPGIEWEESDKTDK